MPLSLFPTLYRSCTHLWQRLTQPHPAIDQTPQTERARLLSGILVGLLVITVAYEVWYTARIQPYTRAISDQKSLFILGGLVLLLVIYWLSRTRHYRWAAACFVVATHVVMLAFIIVAPDSPLDTAWLLLSLIVCSLFFSYRTTALLLVTICLSVLIRTRLASTTPAWFDIVDAEIFLTTIGLLIVAVAALRQQDQRRLEAQTRTLADSEASLRASEERYRNLVTQVTDGFYTCDLHGTLTYANPALIQMLGYEHPEQVEGRRFTDFVAPSMLQKVVENFRQATESGQTQQAVIVEIARPDGVYTLLEIRSSMIMEGNTVIGMRGVLRDVTERTRAEEQTHRHASQMALLNDITRIALEIHDFPALLQALVDRIGELFEADSSYLCLWDEASERVIPTVSSGPGNERYASLTIQPGETTFTGSVLRAGRVLAADDVLHSPYISQRIAAQFPALSLIGLPLIANGKRLGAALITFHQPHHFTSEEIALAEQVAGQLALAVASAQLHAQIERNAVELEQRVIERTAELETTNRELQDAMAVRQKFLARVSHELRTPLNVILGFAQVMEMGNPSPRQQIHIQYILNAGRSLLSLVDALLNITGLEPRPSSHILESLAVQEVAHAAVELMQPVAIAREIHLYVADLPSAAYVRADQHWLGQALNNLLSSVIKYSQNGDGVAVSCVARPNNQWRITVRDSGPGLSAEQRAGLFVPFEQFSAENAAEPGLGLGLVLAKQMVETMGGSMGVESMVGEGNTFWVELPGVNGPPSSASPKEASAIPASSRTVLYIENDPANLRLLEHILGNWPEIRLIAAMQGSLGLELAREYQPEMILLATDLPDVSGREVLRALCADPQTQAIPVVLIGADANPHKAERLLAAGAKAFLTKPMDVQRFLKILDNLC